MQNFKGNVAVITGAASGIGKAIAEKCLRHGMSVMLADIDQIKLAETEGYLKKNNGSRVISCVTNVANENDVYRLSQEAVAAFGKINFLFNNAGIAGALGPLWEQSSASIENVLRVNLLGTIFGIKAFVPIMLELGDQCYIINTSAGAGMLTSSGLSAYKASKHGITAISEVLYSDLKRINANIHVSLLIPHWVNTQMPSSIDESDLKVVDVYKAHLEKFGMCPSDVADVIFEGIHSKKFYVFTNPEEHLPKIQARMESILTVSNPV